jgi:arsenate reductase
VGKTPWRPVVVEPALIVPLDGGGAGRTIANRPRGPFARALHGSARIATIMYNVLFLCTGNSARSILAEALINDSRVGQGKFRGYSAGSHPKGDVHPLAVEILRENGFAVEGLRSKSWSEFATDEAPAMDFVFTVCDQAAAEPCPVWPGQPVTAHWGVPDPASVDGTEAEQRRAFRDAFLTLRRRVELFACLPFESLDRLALQTRVGEIGAR